MYKKIERDNKIFNSEEFLKDKYKFNIVTKILTGDEVLLYSDEENYFFARNREGKPTWIWTKDNLKEKKILEEIIDVMSLYLTDLKYDQFTCKKEFYDYLLQTNYQKLNKEDYFELGFLICNGVKDVKKVDPKNEDKEGDNGKMTLRKCIENFCKEKQLKTRHQLICHSCKKYVLFNEDNLFKK